MKKIYIFVLFVVVLILLGVSTVSMFFYRHNEALSDKSMQILKQPTYVSKGETEMSILRAGSTLQVQDDHTVLQNGDQVRILSSGEAVFRWPDGSQSRVFGPAELQIVKSDMSDTLDTNVEILIQKGRVWTKVLDVVTEKSAVVLRTEHLQAKVLGSEVLVDASSSQESIGMFSHAAVLSDGKTMSPLMEGESAIWEKNMMKLVPGIQEDEFVKNMRKKDKDYLTKLSAERFSLLSQVLHLDQGVTYTKEDWEPLMDFSSLDAKIQQNTLLKIYRTLLLQVKNLDGSPTGENSSKKAKELDDFIVSYILAIETSGRVDEYLLSVLREMTLGQKVLFGEHVSDSLAELRMRFGLARLTLVGDDSIASGVIMQRQLFLVQDFLNEGRVELAKKYLLYLSEFDRVNEPVWKDISSEEKEMMEKTLKMLVEKNQDMRSLVSQFRARILSERSAINEVNTEKNSNAPSSKKNMNTNSSASKMSSTANTNKNVSGKSAVQRNLNVNANTSKNTNSSATQEKSVQVLEKTEHASEVKPATLPTPNYTVVTPVK